MAPPEFWEWNLPCNALKHEYWTKSLGLFMVHILATENWKNTSYLVCLYVKFPRCYGIIFPLREQCGKKTVGALIF